jgi:mannan endo-1,4-beta-mannosidase
MPIVFGEFGVSIRDDRFCSNFRESFMDKVYNTFVHSIETGGPGGGCVLWQLFPEGAEHMDDGYAVILAKYPSTHSLLSLQSKRLCDGAQT